MGWFDNTNAVIASAASLVGIAAAVFSWRKEQKANKSAEKAERAAGDAAAALLEIARQQQIANDRAAQDADDRLAEAGKAFLTAKCVPRNTVVNGGPRTESRLIIENESLTAEGATFEFKRVVFQLVTSLNAGTSPSGTAPFPRGDTGIFCLRPVAARP